MDKNDPFHQGGGGQGGNHDEHDYIDDARYDDAVTPEVREEEYAAGQEEWDQPIDEFAEEQQQGGQQHAEEAHDPFAEGPIEDEFSEHTHHAEDEHHEDGGHGEGGMHEEETAGEQPRSAKPNVAGMKPPSSLMKYIPYVGGGIAVLALAFFGLQMLTEGSSDQTVQQAQNTWDSGSASTNNPPANTQQAANEFQQPAPTPVEQPAPQQQQPMITPTQQAQNVQAPLPQAQELQPNVQMQQQQQPQQNVSALESRISELTQQMEAMKQTQDQLNQKLQTAAAMPPSMDESSKAAARALEDRIAQLEQRMTNIQPSASQVASTPSPSVDAPEPKTTRKSRASRSMEADTSLDQPSSAKPKKASTDFMVAKKPRRSKKHSAASQAADADVYSPAAGGSFQGWILRSAQPGSAWLSQGPYSSDLRRVVPGDKVQGLGTVTAIRQIAGRWVVEGTQGAVR